jgi:hypothetical protein
MSAVIGAENATQLIFAVMRKGGNRMAELKPFEVIMKIDFGANDGVTAVAHAKKVAKLVRCGDCKYYTKKHTTHFLTIQSYCDIFAGDDIVGELKPDDFCSRGERREK